MGTFQNEDGDDDVYKLLLAKNRPDLEKKPEKKNIAQIMMNKDE